MKKKSSDKAVKISTEAIGKAKDFFGKSKVKYFFLAVFVLVIAYLVQYFVNKPNLGAFLGSDMDPMSNVYILGVDKSKDQFKITKILPGGSVDFKINLEKSDADVSYSYRNIEADSKGNFYVVKEKRNSKVSCLWHCPFLWQSVISSL